jgi:hypothetical protein
MLLASYLILHIRKKILIRDEELLEIEIQALESNQNLCPLKGPLNEDVTQRARLFDE